MQSVFGASAEQSVPDVEWLEHAGRSGWVVLTKDKRIRWRASELTMVQDHAIKLFFLSTSAKGLTGPEQVDRLLRNMERIAQHCQTPGPWICAIYDRQVTRIWPRD
jgi:hypothetical protein